MQTKTHEQLSSDNILCLSRHEIENLTNINQLIEAVELAFIHAAEGKSIMPPKLYLDLPEYQGDFRAMPAYINGSAGVKWVCAYPNNVQQNLPTVMAVIILSNPSNGSTLAILDGTYITHMRTGAAGGVAVKYLAKKDSSMIGIIGAGNQAITQLQAINTVLSKIGIVKVFDTRRETAERFAERMHKSLNINVQSVDTIQEAASVDIVVACTPSKEPIVKREYIKPGTHINAIGADAEGKQELDPAILKEAKIIVDDTTQASHSGEINVPLSKGIIQADDIYCEMGEIVTCVKKGRENNDEITVFDSTGLAIQDIICAKLICQRAQEKGQCNYISLT